METTELIKKAHEIASKKLNVTYPVRTPPMA